MAVSLSEGELAQLKNMSREIHANPELGFVEYKAVEIQRQLLTEWGFNYEPSIANLDTAYKASFGSKGPVFCFMSEYDALPEMGHACGHNLIAAASLAAGLIVKKSLESQGISGEVVVMGTPGEEGKGGKVMMVESDAFVGIDASIMAHPYYKTTTDSGCLSVGGYKVSFKGRPSHASAAPEKGANALDAVNLLFAGIGAWRQQLPESCRVHGIITDGGIAPNIIPDRAEASFYLRASEEEVRMMMNSRFEDIVKGAALMTDCEFDIIETRPAYKSSLYNKSLNAEFMCKAEIAQMNPLLEVGTGRISSDFGDVSQILPSAHLFFKITESDEALHTCEFVEAANSEFGFDQAIKTAKIMADIALKFFSDETFREQVSADFANK